MIRNDRQRRAMFANMNNQERAKRQLSDIAMRERQEERPGSREREEFMSSKRVWDDDEDDDDYEELGIRSIWDEG